MLPFRDVVETPFGGLARSPSAKGKAGPSVRPDNSQNQGNGGQQAWPVHDCWADGAGEDPASVRRASELGVALAALAQELASARREIRALKRDNARLRSWLAVANAR
jgi:hypothetical protein